MVACNKNSENMDPMNDTIGSDREDVRKTIMDHYDFINENDLSDSLTFDRYKTLFSDSFVLGPSEGKPLSNKKIILEDWRKLFQENKGKFELTINRIDVSENMAYALYHYDEKLTNIKSGAIYFEVTQSALVVLRKDTEGKWKFEALMWS